MGRDLVARAERGLRGADEASWAANVERHFSDLRAARSWLADTDPELGLQMAAQLHWYALWRCHSEVYRWADASTAGAAGSRSPFYPEALASAAFGAVYRGDMPAAGAAARAAFDAARSLPPISARRPLEALAEVATFRGELAAAVDLYTRAYDRRLSRCGRSLRCGHISQQWRAALRHRRRPPSPVGGAAAPAPHRHRIPRPRPLEKGEQMDGSQVIRFALEAIARAATKP